jgi:hypothetical protein
LSNLFPKSPVGPVLTNSSRFYVRRDDGWACRFPKSPSNPQPWNGSRARGYACFGLLPKLQGARGKVQGVGGGVQYLSNRGLMVLLGMCRPRAFKTKASLSLAGGPVVLVLLLSSSPFPLAFPTPFAGIGEGVGGESLPSSAAKGWGAIRSF